MATPIRRIVDSFPLILLSKIGQLDSLLAGVPEVLSAQSARRSPVIEHLRRVGLFLTDDVANQALAPVGE